MRAIILKWAIIIACVALIVIMGGFILKSWPHPIVIFWVAAIVACLAIIWQQFKQ